MQQTATLVRQNVARLLEAAPAFHQLPAAAQSSLAADMTRIASYLAAPEGIRANTLPGAIFSVPSAGPAQGSLLDAVNFPSFVAGLIEGVFHAIVNASIEQMEAYANLVSNVAKTVDQFLADAITEKIARDWLAALFADCFERDPKTGKLGLKPGGCGSLSRLRMLPGLHALDALAPADPERKIVPAARARLASHRQQSLATMVMMGINRIVVTDGKINAK